jgi:large subunit ribosomal protein L31
MKKEISANTKVKADKHPKYYPKAKVICACGNTFEVGSTMPEIHVEICSACHPLYTGKNKFVDTAGRVDKFQERVRKAKEMKEAKTKKPATTDNTDKR